MKLRMMRLNSFLNNFSGKTSCRVQTRQTLRRIRDKVDGLSFLNSSFLPLVKLLDETINGYDMHRDKKGFIKGAFFYQIIAVTLIMSDVDKIHAYAQGSVSPDLMASEMMPDSEYIHPSQPQQVLPEQQSLKAQAHDSTPVDTVNPSETATVNADASSDVESDQVAPTTAENAVTHEVISDSSESVMQEPSLDIDPFDFDALVDEIMPAEVYESTVQEVIEVAETDQEAEKDDAVPVTESPVLFPGMESMAAPTYAVNETDHAIVPLEEEVELAQTLIPADKVQTSEIEEAFF